MVGRKRYRFGAIKPIPKRKRTKYAAASRIPRNISVSAGQRNIVPITRTVFLPTLVGAASTDELAGYSFQLSDLPNYTQFTALYDQYRILAVKLEFFPQNLASQYTLPATAAIPCAPQLITCVDLDDANTPTSATVQSHESCMHHGVLDPRNGNKMVRWVQPAIAVENYQTGGFGGYTSMTKQWCDAAAPSVQHYGVKVWVYAPTSTPAYTINVFATYYLEFRMPF